jgi:hypothetical protein
VQIGAGNFVPQVEQNLGQSAHANATDADKVHLTAQTVQEFPLALRLYPPPPQDIVVGSIAKHTPHAKGR